jgi:hypothetical protein
MKFPKAISHYGINLVKVMEQDENGNRILGYQCVNFPSLGTTRHLVSTWIPNKEYCESVMGSIHFTISQFIADYIRSVLVLQRDGREAAASAFHLQQANVAPYDPLEEEWPEVLNHHGLLYWRTVEETSSKDVILKYTSREFLSLGTLSLRVDTSTPNPRYKVAILANILHKINQYLVDYFCFLEDLRIKSKQAPIFDLSDPGTSNLR